ncbi:MAG: hypothetical protein ABI995_00215 [Acidobacteriota bacterium]
MTGFAQRAQEILETALSGPSCSQITVLIDETGAVQLCADSDWPLDSLVRERGALSAYRVTSTAASIRVEGLQGLLRCKLEALRPGTLSARL